MHSRPKVYDAALLLQRRVALLPGIAGITTGRVLASAAAAETRAGGRAGAYATAEKAAATAAAPAGLRKAGAPA